MTKHAHYPTFRKGVICITIQGTVIKYGMYILEYR